MLSAEAPDAFCPVDAVLFIESADALCADDEVLPDEAPESACPSDFSKMRLVSAFAGSAASAQIQRI